LVVTIQYVTFSDSGGRIGATLLPALVGGFTLVLLVRALILQRRRMQMDYNLRLATRLSSLIDEALTDVAEREEWSYLRLEATRLRLSAFPLVDERDEHLGKQ